MKTKQFLWSLLALMMIAIAGVGISACGDDDDDKGGGNNQESTVTLPVPKYKNDAAKFKVPSTEIKFKGENIKDRLKKVKDSKRKEKFQGKLGRLVNMYDLNGKVLELYPSLSKAAEANGVSIWTVFNCCKGHKEGQPRLSVGDKIFLYDGDSIKLRLKEIDNLKKK